MTPKEPAPPVIVSEPSRGLRPGEASLAWGLVLLAGTVVLVFPVATLLLHRALVEIGLVAVLFWELFAVLLSDATPGSVVENLIARPPEVGTCPAPGGPRPNRGRGEAPAGAASSPRPGFGHRAVGYDAGGHVNPRNPDERR